MMVDFEQSVWLQDNLDNTNDFEVTADNLRNLTNVTHVLKALSVQKVTHTKSTDTTITQSLETLFGRPTENSLGMGIDNDAVFATPVVDPTNPNSVHFVRNTYASRLLMGLTNNNKERKHENTADYVSQLNATAENVSELFNDETGDTEDDQCQLKASLLECMEDVSNEPFPDNVQLLIGMTKGSGFLHTAVASSSATVTDDDISAIATDASALIGYNSPICLACYSRIKGELEKGIGIYHEESP